MVELRVWLAGTLLLALPTVVCGGSPAYNGIEQVEPWPPRLTELNRRPLAVPSYLSSPPAVIPIDVGRQLLIDDFLVAHTTLARRYHLPDYYVGNPVIRPDQPWEGRGGAARAGVFSDGVWFDPAVQRFKCWYWGPAFSSSPLRYYTCYAESVDGLHWEKPALDVVPGTNVVMADEPGAARNSNTVWLDLAESDPQRRYKMFTSTTREMTEKDKPSRWHEIRVRYSSDGIHWRLVGFSDSCGDRSTAFYNPFRRTWVFSLREGGREVSRCRGYYETTDPLDGLRWAARRRPDPALWIGADELDPSREDLDLRRVPERPWDLVPSQLYNLDCVAYESVLLGLFSVWRGHPNGLRPKINEVCVGFSRDGFHWTRPDRRAFCPVSEKKEDWNWGNVQSAGGCCVVVDDKLYFYVGGVTGRNGRGHADPSNVGLAILRRDGFASLDAEAEPGVLTTRPVRFQGRWLFVNASAGTGSLVAEILDADGNVISPYTRENCQPVRSDSTAAPITWLGAKDLTPLIGRPVRFRFTLVGGSLYAFWVSRSPSGASHGFVAAGGPGLKGPVDTEGVAAYHRSGER